MNDRRSKTSRANLAGHMNDRIDPDGHTTVVGVRLPTATVRDVDAEAARANLTRSDIIRWCIEHALPDSRKIAPYEPW